jgi:hypothetical protein
MWQGTIRQVGAGTDVIDGLSYRALIMSLMAEPSHFKITVNSSSFTAPEGSIDLDIEVMEDVPSVGSMVLRMCLQEDDVPYGADVHEDVTRDMLVEVPITVDEVGEVQNVAQVFPVNAGWVQENLEIVAFIQDDVDKKVHASASTRPLPDYALRFYALGERQVVGLPSGQYNYEPFRVYNLGAQTDTYTATITGDLPAGWSAGLCDDQLCYGPTYSEELAPGEYFELHLMVAPTSAGYTSLSVEMSQTNLVHEFPRNIGYGYFTDDLDVLFVDDDGGDDYEHYFTDALGYWGYTYGVWNRLAGPTDATVLAEFPIVVWATGFAFPTVDEDDRAALSDYMDGGGNLFITGQDIGWEMNDIGGAAYLWYRTYLHANFIADDTNDYTLDGVPGDPISDGIDLVIQGGDGANNQDYPSDIDPADATASVIWTYDANRNGAIKADPVGHRVVYQAFGFEAINNPDDRRATMARIMEWLGGSSAGVQLSSGPSVPAFLTGAPNPANWRTTLQFRLPTPGDARLKVYGANGRMIRTLLDGPATAGTHAVEWDLTDSHGNRLPSGVYFYRLQGDGVDMTRKILLLD